MNKLMLVEYKKWDSEKNAVEYDSYGYGFVMKDLDGEYVNPFNLTGKRLPLFQRSVYSNYTSDGEPYGTKIYQLNDVSLKDGLVWVIHPSGYVVDTIEEAINTMLTSKEFFVDRLSNIPSNLLYCKMKYYFSDMPKINRINDILNGEEKILIKK